MRGGTSKAIMFHARDLPPNRDAWSKVFTAPMGSPHPNGRQLHGMGGGVSYLSKVCVLAPSERDDADIDYTFAQILRAVMLYLAGGGWLPPGVQARRPSDVIRVVARCRSPPTHSRNRRRMFGQPR